MKIIILGAPGVGKGTQAEVVCEYLQIPTISTGNIIREAIRQGNDIARETKELMNQGKLLPDEVVNTIIDRRLAMDDCSMGFVLDGFPRTVSQAEALKSLGVEIDLVIEIVLADETIQQRLSGRRICQECGASYHIQYKPSRHADQCDRCDGATILRKDDHPDVVKERLKVVTIQVFRKN